MVIFVPQGRRLVGDAHHARGQVTAAGERLALAVPRGERGAKRLEAPDAAGTAGQAVTAGDAHAQGGADRVTGAVAQRVAAVRSGCGCGRSSPSGGVRAAAARRGGPRPRGARARRSVPCARHARACGVRGRSGPSASAPSWRSGSHGRGGRCDGGGRPAVRGRGSRVQRGDQQRHGNGQRARRHHGAGAQVGPHGEASFGSAAYGVSCRARGRSRPTRSARSPFSSLRRQQPPIRPIRPAHVARCGVGSPVHARDLGPGMARQAHDASARLRTPCDEGHTGVSLQRGCFRRPRRARGSP